MIAEFWKKVKNWTGERRGDIFTALVIFLVGMGGFGLGRLSAVWPQKKPIIVTNALSADASLSSGNSESADTDAANGSAATVSASLQGIFVASKSGSSYHYPWCPGAQRIKEENKIWFQTKEEAEKRGYKPAANCSGL